MSGRLHRRCAPQDEGKGPDVCVSPVHWRGGCIGRTCLEASAGRQEDNMVKGGNEAAVSGRNICKTKKGLAGNQRMSQDWHCAASRPFCRG